MSKLILDARKPCSCKKFDKKLDEQAKSYGSSHYCLKSENWVYTWRCALKLTRSLPTELLSSLEIRKIRDEWSHNFKGVDVNTRYWA